MYLHALVADDLLIARVDFMQCSVEHLVATVMQGTFDKFSQQLVLALLFSNQATRSLLQNSENSSDVWDDLMPEYKA